MTTNTISLLSLNFFGKEKNNYLIFLVKKKITTYFFQITHYLILTKINVK